MKLLNAVEAQTAAGRATSISTSAQREPGQATSSRSDGKTSSPRTMKSATCARKASPSWKATS